MAEENVQTRERIGVSYVLYRLTEEHREEIVQQVLASGSDVSTATRNRLRTLVGPLRLDGFRPGKAPLHRYKEFFLIAGHREDMFAAPLLRAWFESQSQLAQRVGEFLRERGLLEGEGDDFDREIATFRRDAEWDSAMAELAEQYPDDSGDDLRLMACLVKGALDIDETDDDELKPPPEGVPAVFQEALRALGSDVPGSHLWEYAVNTFPRDVHNLLKEQQAAAAVVLQLRDAEQALIEQHGELLSYFGSDLPDRIDGETLLWSDVNGAVAAIRTLHGHLDGYAAVRDPAAVRSEEAARRDRREALEVEVDAALAALRELEAPPPADAPAAAEEPPSSEEVESLRAEVSELQDRVEALESERDAAVRERDGLVAERDAMKLSVEELERDLEESRGNEENFRQLYLAAYARGEDAPQEEAPAAESVEHAVQLSEERWAGQLEFRLNSRSDLTIPFDKPQQVYDALEWLATVYVKSKTGEESTPDLDHSLRLSCGWKYTPFQSDTTVGMYKDYYETLVDRQKRRLNEHIGTGNGHPRGTIRVAFLWDAPRQRVVVGYVGPHQRTRAT